ncbi:MAG: hypothetical protein DYG89_43825 [Caldilinea sp. CFX5]|nr:hypothetical protein [Caldilinea sp. CFX5]
MAIVEALQSAQFVVNGQGHRTAVLMDIQAWDTLIEWLEDVIDTKIAVQSLTTLQTVGGRPQNAGWLDWDEIREAWDVTEEAEVASKPV